MELTSITKELHEASKRLNKGSKELFNLAKEQAETEAEYRRALALEIIDLKSKGINITLIPDVARGNTSEIKFKRDLAEARYVSGRESLKAIQSQITALQSILRVQEEV